MSQRARWLQELDPSNIRHMTNNDGASHEFRGNGKLGSQTQTSESGARIEVTRVQFYDRITLVSGVITPDEAHPLNNGVLRPPISVSFDGATATIHGTIGDATWEHAKGPREFTITTAAANMNATSIDLRLDDSSVTAELL